MRRVLPTRGKLEKRPLGPPCVSTELAALLVLVSSALQLETAARAKNVRWDSLPLPSSPQDLQSLACPGPQEQSFDPQSPLRTLGSHRQWQDRETPLPGKQSLTISSHELELCKHLVLTVPLCGRHCYCSHFTDRKLRGREGK